MIYRQNFKLSFSDYFVLFIKVLGISRIFMTKLTWLDFKLTIFVNSFHAFLRTWINLTDVTFSKHVTYELGESFNNVF